MRFLLAAVTLLALARPCAGYDRVRVLLSDHAVVCSGRTPAETARHLVETWGALICAVPSEELWANQKLLPWVSVLLPPVTNPAATTDSLIAWKERLNLGAAVVTEDPGLASAATAAGLRVFTQTAAFEKGAVAIPTGNGYIYYRGPTPVFFDRRGYLEARRADTLNVRGKNGWDVLGSTLSAAFLGGDTAADLRSEILLSATHAADSLNRVGQSDSHTRAYAERWRYCLAWWLSPVWSSDTLELFAGQETPHSIQIRAADATVSISGILIASEDIAVTWRTSWPLELAVATPAELTGAFQSGRPGRMTAIFDLECRFGSFRFHRMLALSVSVKTTLQAEFTPPVLFVENEHARSDPDFAIRVASGQLELVNRSKSPLTLQLVWRAESPIELSTTASELTLAPGEQRRAGFTLSIPKDLKYKEYGFGVDVTAGSGVQQAVRGQLWTETPSRTGRGSLGAVGCSQAWLATLPALGVPTAKLVPGSLRPSDLKNLDAVMIRAGAGPSSQAEVNAVEEFAQSGGVVIVDLETVALTWLPWTVTTVKRPGPFAASFYKDDLNWWQSPNGLVGGCFAATSRDPVLTLPPGESGWEPLLVDDQGKGFMYRKAHGRGWYVLIHSGWFLRLEQVERRAHLGLLNLMSAASK